MPASLFPRPRKSLLATELFRIVVLLVLAVKPDGGPLFADENPAPDQADNRKPQTSGLATDRKTTLALEEFRKHLANPTSDAAIDDFRRLQTSEATIMVPADDDGLTFVPLYRSIFENFYRLPARQRRRISEPAAGLAERNLQEIVSNGQFEALPQHILRFAGTEASLKAHVILARLHLNRGNQLGAKGWLTPLTLPGVDDSYRQTAQNILNSLPTETTDPAPTESSSSEPEIPKHIQWNFQNQLSPKLGNQIETFLSVAMEATMTPQTTWRDKIDSDTAYRRTLRGLIAVDLNSGKPRWHYPIEPQLDASLARARSSISAFGRDAGIRSASSQFATFQHTAVANAFCRDNISGRITSDVDRVYFIAGLGSPAAAANTNTIGFMGRTSKSPFLGSQLVSLEKKTGRRVWSTGGITFDLKNATLREVTRGLSGTQTELATPMTTAAWFMGIPAVHRNRLFSVMESAGEMRLVCFAARTGEQLWNTTLAWPEQSIDKDPVRQLWSATPVAKEGVVYCPTTTGWVSCVDEFTRSAMWAGRVQELRKENPIPGRRGQPVVLTQPTSLQERWATSTIIVVKNSLIVLPHEAHEIVILNPTTGKRKRRIAIDSSTVLLHFDEAGIIYSQEARIICRNPSDGEVTWSQGLPVSGAKPTGTAIRRQGSLLVPMTSGAIVKLSLATGETEEVAPDLLPKLAWGQLIALKDFPAESEDLLFGTPNQLLRLSHKTPVDAPADSVKIATDLLSDGKWREALAATQRIPGNNPAAGQASDIAFRSLVQLAFESPAEYLPKLRAAGKSSEQIAQIHVLEFNILINQEKIQAAAEKLTEILKLPTSQLQLFVPELPQEARAAIEVTSKTTIVQQTLQTWATKSLSQLLDSSPQPEDVAKQLGRASTSVLLQLTHVSILPAIHQRISEASSDEESIQLLSHAVEIKSQQKSGSGDDFDKEIELLAQVVTRIKEQSNTAEGEAARLLLNVAAMELPGAFGRAISNSRLFSEGNFSSLKTLRRQHRLSLETAFGEWREGAYRTIPIARLSSSGQIRKTLTLADSDDPFLNHFRWAATNGDHGRLLANGLSGTQNERWSIPGNYQLHSTYSYQQDMLHRVGSILLLKSWTTLTAVSVLDQRVLWSRTYGYAPMTTTSAAKTNFKDFVPGQVQLPSQRLSTSCEIGGSGRGWVALVSGSECSMVDVITGSTLWKSKVSPGNKIVATKNAVVVMDGSDHVALLDSRTGNNISISESTDLTKKGWIPIRNSEELLVCWTRFKGRNFPRLGWVHPLTGEVIDGIDLSDMTRFHFINDSTLVGFNNQRQLLLVGLVSRSVQRYSFKADSKTSATAETPTLNKKQTPTDLPMWDAGRLQVAIDGLNLYVCNRRSSKAQALRGPSNRNLSMLTGELIAINRDSGKQRWSFHDSGHVMATTDEPGFPLLLVIDAPSSAASGTVFQRSVFRGISKLSGKELFRQAIPTTSGLRTLSVVSPTANIIDLGVHGLRVRIDGTKSADTDAGQKKEETVR